MSFWTLTSFIKLFVQIIVKAKTYLCPSYMLRNIKNLFLCLLGYWYHLYYNLVDLKSITFIVNYCTILIYLKTQVATTVQR